MPVGRKNLFPGEICRKFNIPGVTKRREVKRVFTRIRARLMLMCSFLILFTLGIGLFTLHEIKNLNSSYQYLIQTRSEIAGTSKILVTDF
jgi:hypothetical protein